MQRSVVVLVFVAAISSVPTAVSGASPSTGRCDAQQGPQADGQQGNSLWCVDRIEQTVYRPPAPLRRSLAAPTTPRPVTIRIPYLEAGPDGSPCYRRGSERVPRAGYDAEPQYAAWEQLVATYPPCPRAAAEAPDPETVVIEVLERFPLPAPRPSIAPGKAITGLRAFLEPNLDAPIEAGRTTWSGNRSTPLGQVAINAVGRYVVDWGDEVTGPHAGPGGPYPNGNISHVYEVMGTYDVVVTVEWDVAWRMGAATGRLTAPTQGTIADFPVTQLQSVLRY